MLRVSTITVVCVVRLLYGRLHWLLVLLNLKLQLIQHFRLDDSNI
jgi:hypothetical protein